MGNTGITLLFLMFSYTVAMSHADKVKNYFLSPVFYKYFAVVLCLNLFIGWMSYQVPHSIIGHILMFLGVYVVACVPNFHIMELALAEAGVVFILFYGVGWNSYVDISIVMAYHLTILKYFQPDLKFWKVRFEKEP